MKSERRSEKRRGRPPRYADGVNGHWLKAAKETFRELTTKRGLQNRSLAMQAMYALRSEPASWIYEPKAVLTGKANMSFGILEALGRLGDEDTIRRVAADLARRSPMSVSEVRRELRLVRGAQGREPDMHEMVVAIVRVVNRLGDRGASFDQLRSALDLARKALDEEEGSR